MALVNRFPFDFCQNIIYEKVIQIKSKRYNEPSKQQCGVSSASQQTIAKRTPSCPALVKFAHRHDKALGGDYCSQACQHIISNS
jgi:hypothetical protein